VKLYQKAELSGVEKPRIPGWDENIYTPVYGNCAV
jgi:hypothetical protein